MIVRPKLANLSVQDHVGPGAMTVFCGIDGTLLPMALCGYSHHNFYAIIHTLSRHLRAT
jgi:hypothetical protein